MKKIFNSFIKIIKALNPLSNKDTDNKLLYTIKILVTTQLIYFITLIVAEAIIIGISYLFGYNATDHQMPQNITLIISFFGYIIPILTFILYTKKVSKSKPDRIGFDKNYKTFFKGLLLGIISLLLIMIPLLLCGAVKFDGINKNINWLYIVLFFFAYLIQSSMEEVICRGFIFHRLKEKLPIILATIINVLFFVIGHFDKMFDAGIIIGILGVINAILIGLIFTVLTLKDKNIYSAIGFHYIWNFLLYSIVGLNLSGNDTTNAILKMTPKSSFLTGASYGIESSIITTVVYLLILLLLVKRKSEN